MDIKELQEPLLFTDFENDLILLKRFLKRLLTPFELPTPTLSPVRIRPDIDLNLMHLQQGHAVFE